jgi:hypothetical protein
MCAASGACPRAGGTREHGRDFIIINIVNIIVVIGTADGTRIGTEERPMQAVITRGTNAREGHP